MLEYPMGLDCLENITKVYGGKTFMLNIVTQLQTKTQKLIRITKHQYDDWKKQFTLDALYGIRYGQSFCNQFDITDNLLYYTLDVKWCDDYIKKTYL